jgi:hypothetical protein
MLDSSMTSSSRRIGPIGTSLRLLVGLGLLFLAGGPSLTSWGVAWHDALIGFVVLPAIMVAVGLTARHYASGPIRFTGPLGLALNCAVIVALIFNEYTAEGALLFYGATLLISAWRGQPGCEATVVSNLILGRDDQIGCPTFTPIDELEARSRRRNSIASVH